MSDPIDCHPTLSSTDLAGKVVLVTGASRGIGRAVAISCAAAGARVVASGRDTAALAETERACASLAGSCRAIEMDVTDEADVTEAFADLMEQEGRLDVLVNNAGLGRYSAVRDIDLADAEMVYKVNVHGPLLCSREALRLMEPQQAGTIIMIGSVVSLKGYANQAAYTASKHALLGLTKTLAVEGQANGIQVSAVLPGGVDTDMVAQARPDLDRTILLAPDDVARTVLFILGLGPNAAIDTIYLRRRSSTPF